MNELRRFDGRFVSSPLLRIWIGLVFTFAIAAALVHAHALPSTERASLAQPPCVTPPAGPQARQDALARLLASGNPCPRNVLALRTSIRNGGGTLLTAFINNRSRHNPGGGSFSLFEMVTGTLASAGEVREGEFFFGHFTAASGSTLVLDQSPGQGSLMVEAIAWDPGKGLFNFYELLGTGQTGAWFYRGDSQDILIDTELLHRDRAAGRPPFGNGLRCAGCHVNGGPIMKELAPPQNDWWTKARPLPRGGREFDTQLASIAGGFVDGDRLAAGVRAGVEKLNTSKQYNAIRASRSLQEQLRPLFCPVEINFESDITPLDDKAPTTQVPSALLVDPRVAEGRLDTTRADYDNALRVTGSDFPEIDRLDADHAWLGPVKATSDQIAVQSLVDAGLIDAEFVSDVLAVDFTNPALSGSRCSLLKLVPASASGDWRSEFRKKLAGATGPAAKDLLANFTAPERTAAAHRQRATTFLDSCRKNLQTRPFVVSALRLVGQRRAEIDANEISKKRRHPTQNQGFHQILEPGFRVIFPVQADTPKPDTLRLSDRCEITQ